MENAFKLILPHPDQFFIEGDFENETSEFTEAQSETDLSREEIFRHHGVGKRESYSVNIELQKCKCSY